MPLQTFTFENILNSNIVMRIQAHFYEAAIEILKREIKSPEDYRQITSD